MSADPESVYYRLQLEKAQRFQDFVASECWKHGIFVHCFQSKEYQQRCGEGITGIEIKYDGKMTETGNIYIEYAEKTNSANVEYVPSGVMRDDNTWLWIIGNEKYLFFLSKRQLKREVEEAIAGRSEFETRTTPTSKGVLFPSTSETFRRMIVHAIGLKNDKQ